MDNQTHNSDQLVQEPIPESSYNRDILLRDPNLQDKIIGYALDDKKVDGGIIGMWLGTNLKNASINFTFCISIALVLILFINLFFPCVQTDLSIIKEILPVITLALGYIFGKGSSIE